MNTDEQLAALKIQKTWKGFRVRKLEKPQRIQEIETSFQRIRSNDASTRISCFFRSILAKKDLSHRQQLRDEEILNEEKFYAYSLIQAMLRYKLSRRNEFSVKRFHPVAETAQNILSKNVRGFLARAKHGNIRHAFQRYNGFRKCNDAASIIQALVRGVLTRNKLEISIGALLVETRVPEGAVILQRVGRAFLERSRVFMMLVEKKRAEQERRLYLKNMKKKAKQQHHHHQKQSEIDSPIVARDSSSMPNSPLSSTLKPPMTPLITTEMDSLSAARNKKRKVILCQAQVRKFLQRNTLFKMKLNRFQSSSLQLRSGCAILLQKMWRGFLQRKKYETEKIRYRAAMILHGVVSGFLTRCYDVASLHHVKLHKDRILLEQRSATKIASVVRMFFAKKYVWGMNRLVLRIQRVCRAQKDRRYVSHLLRQRSATRIQRKVRAFLKKKREKIRYALLRDTLAAEQERNLAAVLIQALVRMFLARLHFHFKRGLNRIEQMRLLRVAKQMVERHGERKRFREARENMLAKRVQHRWFGYTTLIRENFEILRLETKLEGITLRAMSNLERAHRIEIEEEYIAFVEETSQESAKWLRRYNELHSRLDYWQKEGQFIPSQMIRLYEAQRFARGNAVRKMYQQQLTSLRHQDQQQQQNYNYYYSGITPRRTATTADDEKKKNTKNQEDSTSFFTTTLPSPISQQSQQQQPGSARKFLDSSSIKNISAFLSNNNNNEQHPSSTSLTTTIKEQHSFRAAATTTTNQQQNHHLLPLAMRDFVDLSYTYLSLEVMKRYFVSLRYSTVVRILDASHCSLGDDTASYLIEVCSGMENLEQLNVSHNPFTNIAATKILAWLESKPRKMKSIDLSHTLVSRPYKKCVEGMLKTRDVSQLDFLRSRVMQITQVFDDDD